MLAGLAILGCLVGGATSAFAAAKRVYIADNVGRVEKLKPQTGAVKVVSDDPLLGKPGGITVGKGGKLLVSDFDGGSHAILRVNPENGNVRTVTDSDKLASPFDLAQNRKGQIYVADANAGPDDTGAVFKVDPDSGRAKTIVEGAAAGERVRPRTGAATTSSIWLTTRTRTPGIPSTGARGRSSGSTPRPARSRRSPAAGHWSTRPASRRARTASSTRPTPAPGRVT